MENLGYYITYQQNIKTGQVECVVMLYDLDKPHMPASADPRLWYRWHSCHKVYRTVAIAMEEAEKVARPVTHHEPEEHATLFPYASM